MLPRKIAGRYAEALFDLSQQKGATAEWMQELSAVAAVIDATEGFRALLTHPEIPLKKKEGVVERAFQGKIAPEVLAVLFMLIKRGHEPDMQTIHDIFVEKWNEARRVVPVNVSSAIPLTEQQMRTLAEALARRTGAVIQLQQTLEPDLLAGLVITMGDRVIDASARTALEQLHATITGAY